MWAGHVVGGDVGGGAPVPAGIRGGGLARRRGLQVWVAAVGAAMGAGRMRGAGWWHWNPMLWAAGFVRAGVVWGVGVARFLVRAHRTRPVPQAATSVLVAGPGVMMALEINTSQSRGRRGGAGRCRPLGRCASSRSLGTRSGRRRPFRRCWVRWREGLGHGGATGGGCGRFAGH
jgi:hypothetical protein